ncbi:MAG: type II toxin-antitoxin system PemK/MazF family toxin [Planctomycetota bacterium]|nr:MAG: type II toxin-antitoxin system PemK/MazF family toxin [Planctomycetota bacterium]
MVERALTPAGRSGREQHGTRPAIVVQAIDTPNLSTLVVVPMTTNQAATRFPGCFLVEPTASNGLTYPSVALTNQIRALDRGRFSTTIGSLDASDLHTLEESVRDLLGV